MAFSTTSLSADQGLVLAFIQVDPHPTKLHLKEKLLKVASSNTKRLFFKWPSDMIKFLSRNMKKVMLLHILILNHVEIEKVKTLRR